jgi:hypothetical protein
MNLSNEKKKQILEGFMDIFTRIASKEYQKRTWINGEGPEVDDFDETVNDFFGECDSIIDHRTEFGISDAQYDLLVNFRDDFDQFIIASRKSIPYKFINTIEWDKLRKLSETILTAFNYSKRR